MGSIVLPVREKDKIVTFGIKPYIEETIVVNDCNRGYRIGSILDNHGDIIKADCLGNINKEIFYNSARRENNDINEYNPYYKVNATDAVLKFYYPRCYAKSSIELISIYDHFVTMMSKNRKVIFGLKEIGYNQQQINKYIELLKQLQKLDEDKRKEIIVNTEYYRNVLDITDFLKQMRVELLMSNSLVEFDRNAAFIGQYSSDGLENMESYKKTAEDNGKRLETLSEALALTYPNEKGKFLSKTYIDKRKMN